MNSTTNKEIDSYDELLSSYESADELLASNVAKKYISDCLAKVEVGLLDKVKQFFPWLWFMISKWKLVNLDDYTKAVKYCSGNKNETKGVHNGEESFGNRNSGSKTSLKEKINEIKQDASDKKNKQNQVGNPKFKNQNNEEKEKAKWKE